MDPCGFSGDICSICLSKCKKEPSPHPASSKRSESRELASLDEAESRE